MSIKVSSFASLVPMPKTAEKFAVVIPGLTTASAIYNQISNAAEGLLSPSIFAQVQFFLGKHSLFLVEKAQFPSESWQSDKIWSGGHYIELPTKHNHPEDFRCTISEDMVCGVLTSIDTLRMVGKPFYDNIKFSSIAGGFAFTKPRSKLLTLEIYLLDQMAGYVPVAKRTLKGCYLKSIVPVDLNWQNSTTPVNWQATFAVQEVDDNMVSNLAMIEANAQAFTTIKAALNTIRSVRAIVGAKETRDKIYEALNLAGLL